MRNVMLMGAAVAFAAATDQGAIGQEIGRKLSARDVGWDKPTILDAVMANKESDIFLYRVIGMASGTKKYEAIIGGEKNEGFGLIGQFQIINANGEEFNGSVLYLPGYLQDMVVAGLQAAGEGAGARIALDIYAHYDADAATSYVFTGRSLIAADNAAVDEIKAMLSNTPMPALPAPVKKG